MVQPLAQWLFERQGRLPRVAHADRGASQLFPDQLLLVIVPERRPADRPPQERACATMRLAVLVGHDTQPNCVGH
jgi:hypothetical protein